METTVNAFYDQETILTGDHNAPESIELSVSWALSPQFLEAGATGIELGNGVVGVVDDIEILLAVQGADEWAKVRTRGLGIGGEERACVAVFSDTVVILKANIEGILGAHGEPGGLFREASTALKRRCSPGKTA